MSFEDVKARVDKFTLDRPDSEFGLAHIVLGDYNLEDESITWCKELIQTALAGKKVDYGEPYKPFYDDTPKEELEATLSFLNELLLIPEAERVG